jgi:hypothetical protein
MKLLIGAFLLVISTQLLAADDTYSCVVKDVREASDKGMLIKPSGLMSYQIGMNFIIKKKTGEVVGEFITSDGAVTLEVLDKGREGNNFKTLSTYEPFRQILYIEVLDSLGHKSAPFAFIGFRLSSTFSGVCK